MPVRLIFQDEQLLVCVKPAGVASEDGGLPELLRAQCGGELWCVHRLDRAVGGVMVYARTKRAAAALSSAVAAGGMQKEYLAIAQGTPKEKNGSMRDLLYHDAARNKSCVAARPRRGVKEALLDYELIESVFRDGRTLSALRITLHTGRSHQIRVQFASRGMPRVGDARYGSAFRGCPLALRSARLRFPHPVSGEEMSFSAPPPEDFPWGYFSLHNI